MADPVEGQVQNQDQAAPATEPQGQPDPVEAKLKEAGFNSLDELIKSKNEAHATLTRMAQQNAMTQRELHEIRQQLTARPQVQPQHQAQPWWEEPSAQPRPPDPNDPGRPVTITELKQVLNQEKVNTDLSRLRSKDVETFDRLKPIMFELAAQTPGYYEAIGSDQLLADASKEERTRTARSLKVAFGEDIDLDKLRELAGKKTASAGDPRSAMVPPGTAMPGVGRGASPSGRSAKEQERLQEIRQAIKDGDVDRVIALKFKPL